LFTVTVQLAQSSTQDTVVKLRSSSPNLTVPSSVTIPANATSASTAFTVTPGAEDEEVNIVAWSQNDCREATFGLYATPTTLALGAPTVQAGFQCVKIQFQPLSSSPGLSHRLVYRWEPYNVAYTRTTCDPGEMFLRINSTGSYRIGVEAVFPSGRVVASPFVTVSSLSTGPTLSVPAMPANPVSGVWSTSVTASAGSLTEVQVYRGLVSVGGGRQLSTSTGASTISASVDTTTVPTGKNTFSFYGLAGGTLATTATAPDFLTVGNNGLLSFFVDDFVEEPDPVEGSSDKLLNDVATIRADLPSGTTTWTVDVRSETGTVWRTWSGTGNSVRLAWNGCNSTGNFVGFSSPSVRLTFTNGTTTQSYDRAVTVIAKNPNFLGFIHRFGTHNGDLLYARKLLDELVRMNTFTPGSIRPAVMVRSENFQTTPSFRRKIRNWIKNTGQYFYIGAHGNGRFKTSESVHEAYWGGLTFANYSVGDPGQKFISILSLVSTPRYKFAWIDACQSSGVGTNNPGVMTTSPNDGWTGAFRINQSGGSCLTWNGNALQMFSQSGTLNIWYRWSVKIWEYLANGYSVSDAQFYALNDIPTGQWDTSFFPWSFMDGQFIPKLKQFGNTTLP